MRCLLPQTYLHNYLGTSLTVLFSKLKAINPHPSGPESSPDRTTLVKWELEANTLAKS